MLELAKLFGTAIWKILQQKSHFAVFWLISQYLFWVAAEST